MKYDRNRLSFLIDILVTGMHLPIVLVILIAGEFRRLKRLLAKKKPKSHIPWEHITSWWVPYECGYKDLINGKTCSPQQGGTPVEIKEPEPPKKWNHCSLYYGAKCDEESMSSCKYFKGILGICEHLGKNKECLCDQAIAEAENE